MVVLVSVTGLLESWAMAPPVVPVLETSDEFVIEAVPWL